MRPWSDLSPLERDDLLDDAYAADAQREARLDCIAAGQHAGDLYRPCRSCRLES